MNRALEVVAVGPSALVQDLGRPGLGASGVGRSGAADRASLTLANRLVANDEGAAAVEVLLGGLAVRAASLLTVALAGAAAGSMSPRCSGRAEDPGSARSVDARHPLAAPNPPGRVADCR